MIITKSDPLFILFPPGGGDMHFEPSPENNSFIRMRVTNYIGAGDMYHTIDDLYEHRMALFAILLNNVSDINTVFKSKLHHDGTMFGPDWFIAGIEKGNKAWLTYHLKVDPYWDMMGSYERDRAPKWVGHTSDDVLERLRLV